MQAMRWFHPAVWSTLVAAVSFAEAPRISATQARALIAGEVKGCEEGADDEQIRCLMKARLVGDPQASQLALSLFETAGHVVGVLPEQDFEGGYRGTIHVVPQLPIGAERKHLEFTAGALTDLTPFLSAAGPAMSGGTQAGRPVAGGATASRAARGVRADAAARHAAQEDWRVLRARDERRRRALVVVVVGAAGGRRHHWPGSVTQKKSHLRPTRPWPNPPRPLPRASRSEARRAGRSRGRAGRAPPPAKVNKKSTSSDWMPRRLRARPLGARGAAVHRRRPKGALSRAGGHPLSPQRW